MTVNEVSKLTGVSVRTLQYYDKIGLLPPAGYTEAGYRIYDDESLERLQQILLFKELEFPLKEIKRIINSTDFDRNRALEQQIALLTLKKEHFENLILFARGIYGIGVKNMDFSAFDTKKLDEYAKEAKRTWGETDAYKEFEEKQKDYSKEDNEKLVNEFMGIFKEFGKIKDMEPESKEAQKMVEELKMYITEHFYTCTDEILHSLGKMYSGGGSMTENIDATGGDGTAQFVARAIDYYCKKP
ncbi:MAG: MerR family transcriptional regulator [Lachnospiraceae bacterium]|nr:MerR family transcriptional regulator [Lachnospiraceae bacterium]